MISLMLDPKLKNLRIVCSLLDGSKVLILSRNMIGSISIQCHEHLHPLMKSITKKFKTKIFFITIVVWIFLSKLQVHAN
jgi:hypothetical protein